MAENGAGYGIFYFRNDYRIPAWGMYRLRNKNKFETKKRHLTAVRKKTT